MEKSAPKPAADERAEEKKKKPDRTFGLKLLDVLIYPIFTNVGVIVASVAATYLTARGGDRNHKGELIYGKFGEAFQKRGDWLVGKFKGVGMSHEQANMSKMVFFSFFDGSLLAPFVKLLEDRREKIGRTLDSWFGTTPKDPGVYEAEPKQTWLSLLGGRALTAGIVVLTATILDKTGTNNKLFIEPGKKLGSWLAKKPALVKFAGKYDVEEIAKVSIFETVYSSICTLGLYLTSRRIAGYTPTPEAMPQAAVAPVETAAAEKPAEKKFAHEGLKRAPVKDIMPAGYADKYQHEAASTPMALGA